MPIMGNKKYKALSGRFFRRAFLFVFLGALGLILFGAIAVFYFWQKLPSIEQIASRQVSQSTKIFDRTSEILLYEISNGQKRTIVPLAEIPKYLIEATISIEDKRFYEEPGLDVRGTIRALWTNFKKTGNPLEGQGGSTITQQLVKNAFLSSEQTILRKIKEAILALRVARHFSKDRILELYLNEIPYGPTTYGVEAASQDFFEKPAKELSIAESAILASLPKAPSYYSPWGNHVAELMARQKLILEEMRQTEKISKAEYEEALSSKLNFAPRKEGLLAPHFVLAVRDELVEKYGESMVREGGLRVTTALDWEMQKAAEEAVKAGAEENDRLYGGRNAALVAENPKTGEILALVGSRDYFATSSLPENCSPGISCGFEPNFNAAVQGLRQPGSALKPFAYLTAFEKGYTPETVVFDVPTEFAAQNPNCPATPDFAEINYNKECFHPENFDEAFRGPVSLRQALGQSINVPAVKVLYLAGLADVVKKANDFGLKTLTSPNLYGLSLVLGGGAVRLIDLVGAYSALANDGVLNKQIKILEVKDSSGNILESQEPSLKKVAEPQEVRTVNNILSDVEVRGGLFRNSLALTTFPGYDVALKTGTSNDYRDAWAVGYTPSLVTGIWAGNNDNSPMRERGSSLLAAVPIWNKFMRGVIGKLPQEAFPRPEQSIPQKPILAGDYLFQKQIHSLLFYVDRKNPAGPPPSNPASDPQFQNWEVSVLNWARNNISDFGLYNSTTTALDSNSFYPEHVPVVKIKSPKKGEFVGRQISVFADIVASADLTQANVYWNGLQINGVRIQGGFNYQFVWTVNPPNIQPQNLLEIEAVDSKNYSGKDSVIVYGS